VNDDRGCSPVKGGVGQVDVVGEYHDEQHENNQAAEQEPARRADVPFRYTTAHHLVGFDRV